MRPPPSGVGLANADSAVDRRPVGTWKGKYKLKVEGDTLTGKAAADFGGDWREFDIEGMREKK
jgi:hypothetical protein